MTMGRMQRHLISGSMEKRIQKPKPRSTKKKKSSKASNPLTIKEESNTDQGQSRLLRNVGTTKNDHSIKASSSSFSISHEAGSYNNNAVAHHFVMSWRIIIPILAMFSIFIVSTHISRSNGSFADLNQLSGDSRKAAFHLTTILDYPSEESDLSPGKDVRLSKSLQYLADLDDIDIIESDIPFFFHVPRSGGSTLKDIMGSCLGMVGASDVGARHGHKYDKNLEVLVSDDGSSFVNVDTTTDEGIHRAKNLGLVESGLADYIVTQHLHPAATMFNENQRGRMFTLIRHPIERAVSLFNYLSIADWEPTYDPELAFVSIEMWARSKRIEHNWMVRFLSNEIERDLNFKHLEVAKEVLRTKCVIGLLEEKGETFLRFQQYFGWKFESKQARECQERYLHWGWSNKRSHPVIEEGSPAYKLLEQKNVLDLELYAYAKQLFKEQAKLFDTDTTGVVVGTLENEMFRKPKTQSSYSNQIQEMPESRREDTFLKQNTQILPPHLRRKLIS